jgi:transcriptional regulator with XRE-family HTH domain
MAATLGRKLQKAREERGWSLREVEEKTGIHNAHLSQIEKGKIERPDPNILWTLATLYELSFPELMRLAGHVERDHSDTRRRSLAGAALYALDDLSPNEQRQVLDFMADLKRERKK